MLRDMLEESGCPEMEASLLLGDTGLSAVVADQPAIQETMESPSESFLIKKMATYAIAGQT